MVVYQKKKPACNMFLLKCINTLYRKEHVQSFMAHATCLCTQYLAQWLPKWSVSTTIKAKGRNSQEFQKIDALSGRPGTLICV